MSDHTDLDFKAEYAKSNRASCKACRENIAKDTLRLALMVQSPVFDGRIPNWFHFNCFWRRARVTNFTDIHGFDALRWEDQQKIKNKIDGGGASSKAGGDTVDSAPSAGGYGDFVTEYAKSNKSKCRGCEDNIGKDLVRIGKKEFESERAKLYGPQTLWYHVSCFKEHREELEFTTDMNPENISGFKKLKKDDRDQTLAELGKGTKRKGKQAATSSKKQKVEKTPQETEEEKALREQSQLLWKIRDDLTKDVSNSALKILLEYNSQDIPGGESRLLDRVADCMAFGAMQPCKECKEGQFVYSSTSNGYVCTGNISGWTKCQNITKTPGRRAFKIPKEFHDVDFLKKYKYVKRDRVFPKDRPTTNAGPVSSASVTKEKPLMNMRFVLIGKGVGADVKLAIEGMGGVITTKIDNTVAACISTKEEVKKESPKIKQAKKADVHVVSESFIEAVKNGGAALMIQEHSIGSWGGDPNSRILDTVDGPISKKSAAMTARTEAMYTKSVPSKMKMTVKGGAAVDPESGLAHSAHVLQEKGDLLTAVLGLVDISRGTNSFYKLQALESDTGSSCWIFRSWGRVGTTIGGNKIEKCTSKNGAIAMFKDLYAEKTGNEWKDRKDFVKFPNKFYPLDIDYGQEEEDLKKYEKSAGSSSKLPKAVQNFIQMIFDVENMKKAMVEFEIDLKKMPLGKLSKGHIEKAYSVLTELQKLIDKKGTPTQFLDASNRFYTLIPHDFGMKKPPLLDAQEVVKSKIDMLDNLLEIEVAYKLLKAGAKEGKDPIDAHYEQLKTDIKVLDKKADEYKRLEEYVANTHAATHQMYELEVQEVFKIDREGEASRYRPFKDLHNKMLLWHGSRLTNYAGILSQGLRIAPPEAPVTGYMFGKGIYFADMVSKSANYCATSKMNPTGILLLCEVALGNMHELTGASYVTKLPKGKHSTKGCGMTAPDPEGNYKAPDGVVIPMGKGKPTDLQRSSLLYNEYIVYDVAQVNVKYLLKTNFKYKW